MCYYGATPEISITSFGDLILTVDGYRFTGVSQGIVIIGMKAKFVAFVLIFTVFGALNLCLNSWIVSLLHTNGI